MEPIRIQSVVDHIEEHLTEKPPCGDLAAMMAASEADLQRSLTGS